MKRLGILKLKDFSKLKKYRNKEEHLRNAYNNAELDGYIIEFGVYVGNTVRRIAKFTNQTIYGFDSFEGLPERWKWNTSIIHNKGYFKVDELPKVPKHVKLIKGWFKDTIPVWKEQHKKPIKYLHIDSDLYSSCITILTELNNQISPGTIIVFDELLKGTSSYQYWKDGEWKALHEWCTEYGRDYTPLAKTYSNQATIKVIK